MGKAREREARLMTYWFLALALLTALLVIAAAARIGSEARSQVPATVASEQPGAPLGLSSPQP
jgi:hypothetical protein